MSLRVTLARPKVLDTFDNAPIIELTAAFARFYADPLRAAVLTRYGMRKPKWLLPESLAYA